MQDTVGAGAAAGLVAGVVFGLMMQMMSAPGPDGTPVPMMVMVVQVVGSSSVAVGWLYHLFCILWWVLGGLILMPLLLGMPPFAPLRMAPMLPVAMGSLMGHLVYGAVLGGRSDPGAVPPMYTSRSCSG